MNTLNSAHLKQMEFGDNTTLASPKKMDEITLRMKLTRAGQAVVLGYLTMRLATLY